MAHTVMDVVDETTSAIAGQVVLLKKTKNFQKGPFKMTFNLSDLKRVVKIPKDVFVDVK